MNIARELGSLISGLLAPRAASPAKGAAQAQQSHPRAATRRGANQNSSPNSQQGNDRLTLSSASRDLLAASQKQPQRPKGSPTADNHHQPRQLALPYMPTISTENDRHTTDHAATTSAPESTTMVAETPATRELVRATYGDATSFSPAALSESRKIDLHA